VSELLIEVLEKIEGIQLPTNILNNPIFIGK
jgi:hypothetical protein